MEYKLKVTETLSHIIEVEAESKESALEIAQEMYNNGEIVLDYDDFVCENIKLVENE